MPLPKWKTPKERILLFATGKLTVNVGYAVYNTLLGIQYASPWFLILGAYYAILAVMRAACVLCGRKSSLRADGVSEAFVLRFTGALLLLMSLVLACSVYYCTLFEIAKPGGTIVMITLAAYTFYRVTAATVHAVKVRKHGTALLTTIRNIDFADAAVSLLSLQRAMLISFEGKTAGEITVMNLATGIVVCLLIFILGLTMLFQKKNIRNKETDSNGKIQIGKGK